MSTKGAVTLGELAGRLDHLQVRCWRCERHGLLRVARLIADHGAGTALPDPAARCLLLAEVERRLGLAERLARCLTDPRAPERVRHTLAEMIRFRVLLIAAGYPAANDCDPLRVDPAFKMAVGLCAWLAGREGPGLRGVRLDARRGGIGDYGPHAALDRW